MTLYYRNVTITAALDGTAPTLTNPSATATSTTTADGAVSTNENTGTLYKLASPVLAPLASAVIAANLTQAVTQTGVQAVTFTGLSPNTLYYPHFVHVDSAGNISARVTGAAFTTPATQTLYTRNVTVTAAVERIVSISGSVAGSTITFTTSGTYNLNTYPPTLTYGGIARGVTVTGANTFTAPMPLAGLEPNTTNNFALTVNGLTTNFAAPFLPALGRAVEFTAPFGSFPADSSWRDDELAAITAAIVAGDWAEAPFKSNPTVRMPGGYDVNLNSTGGFWLSDPVGTASGQGLDLESEVVTVPVALIDASDNFARNTSTLTFSPSVPTDLVVIDSIAPGISGATINFSFGGTNITGYQRRIGSGAWSAISGSPLILSGQAENTAYAGEIRPVNGSVYGNATPFNYTTLSGSDSDPAPLVFTPQTSVARSLAITSNSAAVVDVTAGVDVPVSIVGGEYSVSVNNGQDWGPWLTSPSMVRLNYQLRQRLVSSPLYLTAATSTLTAGTVPNTFTVTTLADAVAPVITVVGGNRTVQVGDTWVELGFSATDNADGVIPVQRLSSSGSVNTAVPGTYIINYTATDLAGNVATSTRTVTVVPATPFDGIAPVIAILGGNITLDVGDTWTDPGATAADNVDGDITDQINVSGAVNTGLAGVYPVTYTVTDAAGNTTTATRQVSVVRVIVYPLTDPAPASRTLVVGGALRLEAGGGYFEKQPDEVLDFDIDLTALLTAEADTIIPGSIEVDGGSLVIDGFGLLEDDPARIKVWISGGVDGTNAKIEVTLTTAGYRKRQFELRVIVVDR